MVIQAAIRIFNGWLPVFYTEKMIIEINIKKINDLSSAEFTRMMADIDKVVDYLLFLILK